MTECVLFQNVCDLNKKLNKCMYLIIYNDLLESNMSARFDSSSSCVSLITAVDKSDKPAIVLPQN